MDFKYIEQLLERYWRCETSLEEEAQLRAFFNGNDIPTELLPYKDLFIYQQLQQEERLDEGFDARLLAKIEAPVVKAKRLTLVYRFAPLFKVALSEDAAVVREKQILDSLHRVDQRKEIKE
jgi:hypothetical protein